MASQHSPQGQERSGLSGGALAAVIAIPIIFGVCLLITIPLVIARYRQRKARKMDSAERGMNAGRFIHQRTMSDLSDTDKPLLLTESPPRSSFARVPLVSPVPPPESTYGFMDRPDTPDSYSQFPSISLNFVPLGNDRPSSQQRLADLAAMAIPSLSPPPASHKPTQPILLSIPGKPLPEQPGSQISRPEDASTSTDLYHRPSFLTKPRAAPALPGAFRTGPSRRGRPDMRGALLTRMATKRSRSQGDPMEDDSPVSIYSQASMRRGDTRKWFPKRRPDAVPDAPPVPTHPQMFDFSNGSAGSPSDVDRSHSFSGMPSPSRYMFRPSPTEAPEGDLTFLQYRLFNDDTALPSPETSLVSNGRWWSNVWGSYIPSSPTNPSPTQTTTGGLALPVGRRSFSHRMSTNPTTKHAPGFHASPEYGVVDEDYGNVDAEQGQVMVAAWSLGRGDRGQERVEREVRRLPPAPRASGQGS